MNKIKKGDGNDNYHYGYGRSKTIHRFLTILLVLAGGALALAACGRQEEPIETAVPPTNTPPEKTATAWDRVQSSGRLVIGTAADYPPFEYYTGEFQLDGLDVVLISEIAQKLGVTPEFKDMAFEGLGGALQLGQIDVAIAALSVTDEREAIVDFSNVYFVSEDAALARADDPLEQLQTVEELTTRRVGVQRNTVYDNWLQENLVDTGLMPQENLLVYDKIENAIRDLKENRLDIVALDLQPAQIAVSEGGVKIVGQGLNLQRYAIAMGQGETELQTQINRALTELQNNGRLSEIVAEYTKIEPEQLPPLHIEKLGMVRGPGDGRAFLLQAKRQTEYGVSLTQIERFALSHRNGQEIVAGTSRPVEIDGRSRQIGQRGDSPFPFGDLYPLV